MEVQQETDSAPYTTYVAAGAPKALSIQATPNAGTGENDLFAATTAADGSTWAVGWDIDTTTGNHDPLILQSKNGVWSLVSSPSLGASDSGFAAVTAVPGGGLWAVGVTAAANTRVWANHRPLISLSALCACHREGPEHPKIFSRISGGGSGGDGAPNSNTTPAS